MIKEPSETDIREYISHLTIDDLANWGFFSLNFLRQFSDRINWKAVFMKLHFYSQFEEPYIINRGNMIDLKEFCEKYNKKFFNEYFKNKEEFFK